MKSLDWTARWIACLLCLLLAGCSVISLPQSTGLPLATPSASPETSPTPLQEPAATSTPQSQTPEVVILRLWLPPRFDPHSGTPAGDLLNARLQEFLAENPGLQLEVRIKAESGPGGLLEALTAASAAAPAAQPDLIALSRPMLESAALKGLLYPYEGLSGAMGDGQWYEYARQLARLQNSTFGLPFAGDVLLMAYRPAVLGSPPGSWETVIALGNPLLMPAADPEALFTLALYRGSGGTLQDAQGRPALDESVLAEVLAYYQQAAQAGVLPVWLTDLETSQQVWDAYATGEYTLAIAWASNFLTGAAVSPGSLAAAPIPNQQERPYSLGTGWVWALSSQDPYRRELAARLAEFLVEDAFLGQWTYASGYLPPRSGSLFAWPDVALRNQMDRISLSARLAPSTDLLSSVGPVLEQAVAGVLKGEIDPLSAAHAAAQALDQP